MVKIILALDVLSKQKAIDVIKKNRKKIDMVKIGLPLILYTYPEIIYEISKEIPVIVDLKIADIIFIADIIAKRCFDLGATGVICHSLVPGSIKGCVKHGPTYVIGDMTVDSSYRHAHKNPWKQLHYILHYKEIIDIKGIVVPSTEPQNLHHWRYYFPNKIILCPGIGIQGGKKNIDADYLIIGRNLI